MLSLAITRLFSIPAIVLLFVQVLAAMAVDYPVGMTLGQYHLSSAYYNSHNELINVVTITSSQEWQEHYWNTWKDKSLEKHEDPETVSIYTNTLKSIQAATEKALSRPVEIRAITIPAHFFENPAAFNIRLATSNLSYFPDDHYDQVIASYNAARLAYSLDSCRAFGIEEGCDIFEEDNFALVIEFAPHYLGVRFLSITDYYCAPQGRVVLSQYGEVGNSEHLTDPNSEYFQGVTTTLSRFIDEMIAKMTEENIPDPKPKVRGIILTGEASKEGMEDFKELIKVALPEYEDRFMFDIDPLVIGAVGAAHRARQWASKNAFMNPRAPVHDDL